MKKFSIACLLVSASVLATAKIAAPVLDDAGKAKAAETAAKTAWSGKVDGYKICKSQDKSAASYYKTAKATGQPTKPATQTPACADPGPFVYKPAPAVVAVAPAAAAQPAAAPSATAAPAKKS
jgi:hypothetical protein